MSNDQARCGASKIKGLAISVARRLRTCSRVWGRAAARPEWRGRAGSAGQGIAVPDRQGGAENAPDVGEREPPALAGGLAQGSEQELGCAHAVLAWSRTPSTESTSAVTCRSSVRRSRWELRRRMVFGSTAIASGSSTPVV